MIHSDVNDTAIFINKVNFWWKVLNIKANSAGDVALKMAGPKGKRIKQLSIVLQLVYIKLVMD